MRNENVTFDRQDKPAAELWNNRLQSSQEELERKEEAIRKAEDRKAKVDAIWAYWEAR